MSTRLPLPHLRDEDLNVVPLARAETIPSAWYVDPAFYQLDEAAVFEPAWQYIALASQLAEPGAYIRDEISGNPVVVVRDRDEVLKAYFNVCRHRGGPLVTNRCGIERVLQCKYHGWTYLPDGSLRGVPRFDRTDLFDKKDFGLVPLSVSEWQGLVFVSLADDPPPVDHSFAGIPERIAPIKLSDLLFSRRVAYDVDCNWKVYVDNYLEGYHLPLVHPELCDLLDYRSYLTETYPRYSLQYSPFREGENLYSSSGGEAYYYFVFPNLMLNILPDRLQVNRVVPLAADRTRVLFDYAYLDVSSSEAKRRIEDDIVFSDRVQQEDIEICEQVQRGLSSRAYDKGRFSVDAEAGVYHFQSLLKDAYRTALARPTHIAD